MKIKPVADMPAPKYPDKYDVEIRKMLTSARPRRWLELPLAGMLSATVALSVSGCVVAPAGSGAHATEGTPAPPNITSEEICDPSTNTNNLLEHVILGDNPVSIPFEICCLPIPVFMYGEGTGAIGCLAITAPVFLSEEEAFAVISAALSDAGLSLCANGEMLENINIPVTNLYEWDGTDDCLPTKRGSMMPDGTIEAYNIPVEFVSTDDFGSWHKETGYASSVSGYQTRRAALTLAGDNPGLAVFYDPLAGNVDYGKLYDLVQNDGESDKDYEARRGALIDEAIVAARAESEDMLRMQVEAFIDWLWSIGVN